MKNKNYRVSRATLYNTIELLLDCNLVIKHQFGKNIAQFERAYQCGQHDHLIDIETGKVIEFCDPRIHEIINTASELHNFSLSISFPLYLRTIKERIKSTIILTTRRPGNAFIIINNKDMMSDIRK